MLFSKLEKTRFELIDLTKEGLQIYTNLCNKYSLDMEEVFITEYKINNTLVCYELFRDCKFDNNFTIVYICQNDYLIDNKKVLKYSYKNDTWRKKVTNCLNKMDNRIVTQKIKKNNSKIEIVKTEEETKENYSKKCNTCEVTKNVNVDMSGYCHNCTVRRDAILNSISFEKVPEEDTFLIKIEKFIDNIDNIFDYMQVDYFNGWKEQLNNKLGIELAISQGGYVTAWVYNNQLYAEM